MHQQHQQHQQQYNAVRNYNQIDPNVLFIRIPSSSSSLSSRRQSCTFTSSLSKQRQRLNVDEVHLHKNSLPLPQSSHPLRRSPEKSDALPGISFVSSDMQPEESLRLSLALSANEQLIKRRKETDAFTWAHESSRGGGGSVIKRSQEEEPPSADGRYGLPWTMANKAVESIKRVSTFI
jgi:hypothetical protein